MLLKSTRIVGMFADVANGQVFQWNQDFYMRTVPDSNGQWNAAKLSDGTQVTVADNEAVEICSEAIVYLDG